MESWWGDSIIKQSFGLESSYDIIILQYWLSQHGAYDAVRLYENIFSSIGSEQYGTNNQQVQKTIQQLFHQKQKKLFISIFGPHDLPTKQFNAVELANKLGNWVEQNPFIDGIDISYEDSEALQNSTGVEWIVSFHKTLVSRLCRGKYIIIHSPKSSYFYDQFHQNRGSYMQVNEQVGSTIDWYNIQFDIPSNQSSSSASSCYSKDIEQSLYSESIIYNGQSLIRISLPLLAKKANIPLSKISIGKLSLQKLKNSIEDCKYLGSIVKHGISQLQKHNQPLGLSFYQLKDDTERNIFEKILIGFNSRNSQNQWQQDQNPNNNQTFNQQQYVSNGISNQQNNQYQLQQNQQQQYQQGYSQNVQNFNIKNNNQQNNLQNQIQQQNQQQFQQNKYLQEQQQQYSYRQNHPNQNQNYNQFNQQQNIYGIQQFQQQYQSNPNSYQNNQQSHPTNQTNIQTGHYSQQNTFSNNEIQQNNQRTINQQQNTQTYNYQHSNNNQAQFGQNTDQTFNNNQINQQNGENQQQNNIQKNLGKEKENKFMSIAYINRITCWYGTQILDCLGFNSEYDILILSFWLSQGGATDTVQLYRDIHQYLGTDQYGKNNLEVQKSLRDMLHKKGKKLFISAFGGTDFPTNKDAAVVASELAKFANDLPYIDGIDIDYEDNEAMEKGTAVNWLIIFTKELKKNLQNKNIILTHAPQAPYFSRVYYQSGGYSTIHERIGDLIDWYNVQFYNQGNNTYDSIQNLFIQSGSNFPETSIKEIVEKGRVPLSKIILGKPATKADATNTGYIDPASLGKLMKKAKAELQISLPGFFIWQYSNDSQSLFLKTLLSQIQ